MILLTSPRGPQGISLLIIMARMPTSHTTTLVGARVTMQGHMAGTRTLETRTVLLSGSASHLKAHHQIKQVPIWSVDPDSPHHTFIRQNILYYLITRTIRARLHPQIVPTRGRRFIIHKNPHQCQVVLLFLLVVLPRLQLHLGRDILPPQLHYPRRNVTNQCTLFLFLIVTCDI